MVAGPRQRSRSAGTGGRTRIARRRVRGDHMRNRVSDFLALTEITGDFSGTASLGGSGAATGQLVSDEGWRVDSVASVYGSLDIDVDGNWTYTAATALAGVTDTVAVATVQGRRSVISVDITA